MSTSRAVVLARGLGTRMRAVDPDAHLTDEQRRAADAGLKPMIPVNGRPFLDYVLSSLADAGIHDAALVVAPDHEAVRRHYADAPPARIRLSYIVQQEPLGTANATLAVERWTGGDGFLIMNGDNIYPTEALAALARLDEPGLPAFDRDDLVRSSNIPPDRVLTFALIDVDDRGYLTRIVEKPSADQMQLLPPEGGSHGTEEEGGSHRAEKESGSHGTEEEGGSHRAEKESGSHRTEEEGGSRGTEEEGGSRGTEEEDGSQQQEAADPQTTLVASAFRRKNLLVSMNCWRFDSRIFPVCRDVPRSARGEFELPEAVGLAVRRGMKIRALAARGPVLDLSRRADAADVSRRLASVSPRP